MKLRHILDKYHIYPFLGVVAYMLYTDPSAYKMRGKESDGTFSKSDADLMFVVFWVSALTVARFFTQRLILWPVARFGGLDDKKTIKFGEAGWFGIYYTLAVGWELTTFPGEGWLLDTKQYFQGYPHKMSENLKFFYLMPMLSFWLHALVVLFVEKKRGDFFQMLSHHFITIAMIAVSYNYGYTRVGAAIMIEQDVADGILYWTKCFNYLGEKIWACEMISNVLFVLFALTWLVTRHGLFFVIYHSIWVEQPLYIQPCWDEKTNCFSPAWIQPVFLVALAFFQGLLLFWFSLIIKLIYKIATGGADKVEDTRSDDESDSDDEAETKKQK